MLRKTHSTIMIILLVFSLAAAGCSSTPEAEEAQPVDAVVEVPADEQVQTDEETVEEPQDKESQDIESVVENAQDFVIGYKYNADNTDEQGLADLQQACDELGIQCVQGDSYEGLAEQGVDAIISFTNIWESMGDSMKINDVAGLGFPIYVLDGETDAPGSYSLAFESDWVHTSLQWMFAQMGGAGEMVYFNFGPNDFMEGIIQNELAANPDIQATSIPASFDDNSIASQEKIASMVAEDPTLGAIWASNNINDIFWGLNDIRGDQYPAIICSARQDELQSWKDRTAEFPAFQCVAAVKPGGNAYEAVYVAYYRLIGMVIDPAALGGEFGNNLLYDDSVITNDDLDEWLAREEGLRLGEWGFIELAPMTPEEIKDKWFLE